MAWWTWASIAYGVVALLVLRPLAGHFAWETKHPMADRPYKEHWQDASLRAFAWVLFWWAIFPIFGYVKLCRHVRVGAERKGERELARKEHARQFAQTERDVGLGE